MILSQQYREHGPILAVAASQFESTCGLIAVATKTTLIIDRLSNGVFKPVIRYQVGQSISHISWSPQSQPDAPVLAASFHDGSIRLFSDSVTIVAAAGGAWISSICMDCNHGNTLASLSSNKKCLVWTLADGQTEPHEIQLPSNGRCVQYHEKLAEHILIGCENGDVRLRDLVTKTWIFSIYIPTSGLLRGMSWNPDDPNIFGVAVDESWNIWNISNGSNSSSKMHGEGAADFKYFGTNSGFVIPPRDLLRFIRC